MCALWGGKALYWCWNQLLPMLVYRNEDSHRHHLISIYLSQHYPEQIHKIFHVLHIANDDRIALLSQIDPIALINPLIISFIVVIRLIRIIFLRLNLPPLLRRYHHQQPIFLDHLLGNQLHQSSLNHLHLLKLSIFLRLSLQHLVHNLITFLRLFFPAFINLHFPPTLYLSRFQYIFHS